MSNETRMNAKTKDRFAVQVFNETSGEWAVYDDAAPAGDKLVAIFYGSQASNRAYSYAYQANIGAGK